MRLQGIENKQTVSFKILHDRNDLSDAVVSSLQDIGAVELVDEYMIPERCEKGAHWVVVASLREHSWLDEIQTAARAADIRLLIIGLEPGFIWIGPYVDPKIPGCFNCMKHWAHNNTRQDHHWSVLADQRDTRRDTLPICMPLQQQSIFSSILSLYVRSALLEGAENSSRAVTRLDLANTRTSNHRFVPLHNCGTCSNLIDNSSDIADQITLQPSYKQFSSDSRVQNLKLNLDRLKTEFLDRHIGLIKHVFYSLTSNLMPMYSSELPISHTKEIENGYGRSETKRESELVAILEALERYCGLSPKGQRTNVRGSYNSLSDNALDPKDLILHDETLVEGAAFTLHKYTEQLEVNWVWCKSLTKNCPILVPEQSIFYFLLNTADTPVNRFVYETSNGCALGGSMEEAIFYGLLELVERDAYLTTWYGKFTPREIELDSIDSDRVRSLIYLADTRGFSLHAFDIRVGVDVPAVWCMIVDHSDDAPVKCYCAAGAHLDPEKAIYSGLIEVMTSMGVYRESLPPLKNKAEEMLLDDDKVLEMHDHVLLYSLPDAFHRLNFLFSEQKKLTLDEVYGANYGGENLNISDDLVELIDKVGDYAKDVIVADLSVNEFRDHQLFCVKVIAPGLMPVTFGHQYRRISIDRINKFANKSGLKPFSDLSELNQYPHNFP
ncbi:MAG: ribosomal protein S12 methylthiotransferase accessory factor [Arenicella sp.]|jgi:ribosomal protein S12 methylthiotransferase accessory factor